MALIRTVLAVLLAAALLGATQPMIDRADATRERAELRRAADRVQSTAAGLVRDSDPVRSFTGAARRSLSLSLPGRRSSLAIGERAGAASIIRARTASGSSRVLVGLPLPVVVPTASGWRRGPLIVAGSVRISIRYLRLPGGPRLVLERSPGRT